MNTIFLYFHTIRFLRPRQLLGRVWHYIYNPGIPQSIPLPLRSVKSSFQSCQRQPSMLAVDEFYFLNQRRRLTSATDWNNEQWPLLWRYNLHYFDDLTADNSVQRQQWHVALITRWIADNPAVFGAGWR